MGRLRLSADLILGVLLTGAVLFSYGTYARLWLTRPSLGDYERAAAQVRARFEPGDHIEVTPFWAERVREYLGDLSLSTLRRPDVDELRRHRRVWLFSLDDAHDGHKARLLSLLGPVLSEERFGRIGLRLHQVSAPAPVRFDFRDQLRHARVWLESGDRRIPCAEWSGISWRCMASGRYFAGREIVEIGGDPRPVIAAATGLRTLGLEFEGVPLGTELTIGGGFPSGSAREGEPPVEVVVEIDGRPLMRRAYEAGAGFVRHRVQTPGLAAGAHRVGFRLISGHPRLRTFGFSAEVRP